MKYSNFKMTKEVRAKLKGYDHEKKVTFATVERRNFFFSKPKIIDVAKLSFDDWTDLNTGECIHAIKKLFIVWEAREILKEAFKECEDEG